MALHRRRLFLVVKKGDFRESPVCCSRIPLPCSFPYCPPRSPVAGGLSGPRASWSIAITRPIYREYIGLSVEEYPPRQWDSALAPARAESHCCCAKPILSESLSKIQGKCCSCICNLSTY